MVSCNLLQSPTVLLDPLLLIGLYRAEGWRFLAPAGRGLAFSGCGPVRDETTISHLGVHSCACICTDVCRYGGYAGSAQVCMGVRWRFSAWVWHLLKMFLNPDS